MYHTDLFCLTAYVFLWFYSYNLESSTWDVVPINGGPLQRYGHSLALHKVSMVSLYNNAVSVLTVCILIDMQNKWFTNEKMSPWSLLSIMLQVLLLILSLVFFGGWMCYVATVPTSVWNPKTQCACHMFHVFRIVITNSKEICVITCK